jgi:DNA-binding transcriptional MerR regulator
MTIVIKAQTYYRTAEVCKMVGVSKNTLFRWLTKFVFSEMERRDSRGWRLFTEEEVEQLKVEVSRINLVRRQEFKRLGHQNYEDQNASKRISRYKPG